MGPLRAMMGVVERRQMTITNLLEVVVVLAILICSLPFLPETGLIVMSGGVPVKSPQAW